jgi:hypothetical protein
MCLFFQIVQLAAAQTGGRPATDEFRRRRFPDLEPPARRRLRQLRPPETRDGVHRTVDDDQVSISLNFFPSLLMTRPNKLECLYLAITF